MAKDKIEIEVLAKGVKEAQRDIDKLNKKLADTGEESKKSTPKLLSSLKSWALGFAAVGTAIAGVRKAIDFTRMAAGFNQSVKAMEKQFGVSSNKIISKLKEVSKGTISNTDIVTAANKAMALNVTKDVDQMAKLMEVARVRGQAMGLDTTQAFEDIVTGIGRGSPLILDNLGIITKGWAEEAKAAGQAMDAQFILNKVLSDGADILAKTGDVALTDAEKFQKFGANIKNISIGIGSRLMPVLTSFLDITDKLLSEQSDLSDITSELIGNNREYARITNTLADESKNLTAQETAKLKIRKAELRLDITKNMKEMNKLYEQQQRQLPILKKRLDEINHIRKLQGDEIDRLSNIEKKSFTDKNMLKGLIGRSNIVLNRQSELILQVAQAEELEANTLNSLSIALKNNLLSKGDLVGLDQKLIDKAIELSQVKQDTNSTIISEETELTDAMLDLIDQEDKAREAAYEAELQRRKALNSEILSGSIDTAKLLSDTLFTIDKNKRDGELELEGKTEEQKKQIKRKAYEEDKKASRGQNWINTALAVTKTFATLGWPAGIIPAGLALSGGFAQDAVIGSQVNPYRQGTSFSAGGTALVGEAGPEIVNLPQGSEVIPNNVTNNESTDNRNTTINVSSPNAIEFVNDLQQTYGINVFEG